MDDVEAPEQTLKQLRDVVRRAQHRLDTAGAEDRKQRAYADRSVRITDAGDGMVWFSALLAAEHAHACMQKIDAAARVTPEDDERTLEQRRADVLVDAIPDPAIWSRTPRATHRRRTSDPHADATTPQTPSRLDRQTQPRRNDNLDQPPRPRIHQPSPRTLENPRRMICCARF